MCLCDIFEHDMFELMWFFIVFVCFICLEMSIVIDKPVKYLINNKCLMAGWD